MTLRSLLSIFLIVFGVLPGRLQAEKQRHDLARVEKVIDGDTLLVAIGGKREHLRLIGIDTPESKYNKRAEMQAKRSAKDLSTIYALGKRAAEFSASLAPSKSTVFLEYDVERRDQYDRLLAYVHLPDGRLLNEELLRAGHASLLTYPPNIRYLKRLQAAFQQGQKLHSMRD
jgi:micrococcal nuclease